MEERKRTLFGPNLTIYLDKTNASFTDRLMHYHDKKMAIKPTDSDCVTTACTMAGKISGYLDALVDLEIINQKEHEQLYIKYCHKHL